MFRRKAYDKMLKWKNEFAGSYACLLEGARRVGKSTIAEEFAKNEYDSYLKIDFANVTPEILSVFDDISKLDLFFLRLQAETGVSLVERKSALLFDEIQLFPKVRQAIKYLVKDGRYDYIETGSLISIKKNVKEILIPSEEYKISVYPMDYEEFLWATGKSPEILRKLYKSNISAGNETNRTLMRDFRLYMAVGGMPQAVEAYIQNKNFNFIDNVKREIISLYFEDLKKVDSSGRLSALYKAIPSQLALKRKKFSISAATGKQKNQKDEERIFDLVESKIALPCYNVENPSRTLSLTKDLDYFKLYVSDSGLFVTLMFYDSESERNEIYKKLLSDKLNADLGYLYENVAAQMINAAGKELYFHTWQKENSTHSYEIDFLLSSKNKIIPVEVKSSAVRNHESLKRFSEKYSASVEKQFLISQKDVGKNEQILLRPVYMLPFILEEL